MSGSFRMQQVMMAVGFLNELVMDLLDGEMSTFSVLYSYL